MTLVGYTQQSVRDYRPNTNFFLPQLVMLMEGDNDDSENPSLDSLPGVLQVLRWWVRELTKCYEYVFRKSERLDRVSVQMMLITQPDSKVIDCALEYLTEYIDRVLEDDVIAAKWIGTPVLLETTGLASELGETSRIYRRTSERVVAAYRRARGLSDDDNDDDGEA